MNNRFPHIEVKYYPVDKDLTCRYPWFVNCNELLVFIHYFGYENKCELPKACGALLEDVSHSYFSRIEPRGDYIFGSIRKVIRIGDGGFINTYFNPIYEESKKLDTWLRYQADGWPDMREAENMLDRDWQIADMSSQSLATLRDTDKWLVRQRRKANEYYLLEHLCAGKHLRIYTPYECPLFHTRVFETQEERDSLRAFLAARNIFTSIHWPVHESVKSSECDIEGALWFESHTFSIPVAQEYDIRHMEYICESAREWGRNG